MPDRPWKILNQRKWPRISRVARGTKTGAERKMAKLLRAPLKRTAAMIDIATGSIPMLPLLIVGVLPREIGESDR